MTGHTLADTLDESMDLSDERRAAFENDYELRLSPEAVFIVKGALEAESGNGATTKAEDVANTLLAEFRQQTVDTNTAEMSGAEWYHIYGSVFTLVFDADDDTSPEAIRATTNEIRSEMPAEITEIMEQVENHMEAFVERMEGDDA